MERIGFGGGCHWCTEAVFESLPGVRRVEQGWLEPAEEPEDFSEGVIVHFDAGTITLETLVAVHLHTHSSTSNHALRGRYRSAVYAWSPAQQAQARSAIERSQPDFDALIITRVLRFGAFHGNPERPDFNRRPSRSAAMPGQAMILSYSPCVPIQNQWMPSETHRPSAR